MRQERSDATISDFALTKLIEQHGTQGAAQRAGITDRNVRKRKRLIEQRLNRSLVLPTAKYDTSTYEYVPHGGRIPISMTNGIILIGGDCHYWPGPASTMHRAFVFMAKELKPKVVILNGDVCDFPGISRHARIGWENLPEVGDEVEAAKERLWEIEKVTFKAKKLWPIGNHDMRFNTALANSEKGRAYAKIHGFSLQDHFPLWQPCWRVDINGDLISKHRGKGGKHSVYRNALEWGVSAVTGHDHSPYVRAITDAKGTRWGINHGCIADPEHECFVNYTEDSPAKDWRSAFAVLTFKDSRLLPPELVESWDKNHVVFRGSIIKV